MSDKIALTYHTLVDRLRDALGDLNTNGNATIESKRRELAQVGALFFGNNDSDVKLLLGIEGPVANSVAYTEKHNGGFLVILPGSRQYTPGDDAYAFYTAAVLDNPADIGTARCVRVHTNYLATKCDPFPYAEIPDDTRAVLVHTLARKDVPGTWDKKYVLGEGE